jgi:hypothetical protein
MLGNGKGGAISKNADNLAVHFLNAVYPNGGQTLMNLWFPTLSQANTP